MATCAAEVTWLIGLFKELGVQLDLPVNMDSDSKVVIQIAVNPIFHQRTKHIDIDCHFVREKVCQGILKTEHVTTKNQPADLLTKGLGRVQHNILLNKLGMKNVFQP